MLDLITVLTLAQACAPGVAPETMAAVAFVESRFDPLAIGVNRGARLNRQPRDAARVRVRNRDAADGRPRGYLRKFGLSRVRMRGMAHRGELPGVRKSSW